MRPGASVQAAGSSLLLGSAMSDGGGSPRGERGSQEPLDELAGGHVHPRWTGAESDHEDVHDELGLPPGPATVALGAAFGAATVAAAGGRREAALAPWRTISRDMLEPPGAHGDSKVWLFTR